MRGNTLKVKMLLRDILSGCTVTNVTRLALRICTSVDAV